MKIHQLPMGARFEYAGQTFVKTGPAETPAGAGECAGGVSQGDRIKLGAGGTAQ
jgi:hypothetical protein